MAACWSGWRSSSGWRGSEPGHARVVGCPIRRARPDLTIQVRPTLRPRIAVWRRRGHGPREWKRRPRLRHACAIAAALRLASGSDVAQFDTEMRIAAMPCQAVPLSQ